MILGATSNLVRPEAREGPATSGASRAGSPSDSTERSRAGEVLPERRVRLRILVAFEDDYRAYREAIAYALRELRPHADVAVTGPDALESELARLAPHVVICSRPDVAGPGRTPAWVELPSDPERPAEISLEGRRSEASHLTLDDLLAAVDEAERLVRAGSARPPA